MLIVIVGFVEATAVSRALATKHGYQVDRETKTIIVKKRLNAWSDIFKQRLSGVWGSEHRRLLLLDLSLLRIYSSNCHSRLRGYVNKK